MKIKHKVIREFQYLSPEKKIFILKSGIILEEYTYKVKDELIPIDKDIIDNNPEFFQIIDWKAELMSYMRSNKMPQPAQLGKKLIPFIEDMILSSMNEGNVIEVDEDRLNEIKRKETELDNRDNRIKSKEEELEIRLSRVEKREIDYKEDLKQLDNKEDNIREKFKDITNKELEVNEKERNINEKERNLDRSILESSKNIDTKYVELQSKIDKDLKIVTDKEKDLELLSKDIKNKESDILQRESENFDRIRDFELQKEEFVLYSAEIRKIDTEIKEWEALHWKFKRMKKPPSIDTPL